MPEVNPEQLGLLSWAVCDLVEQEQAAGKGAEWPAESCASLSPGSHCLEQLPSALRTVTGLPGLAQGETSTPGLGLGPGCGWRGPVGP